MGWNIHGRNFLVFLFLFNSFFIFSNDYSSYTMNNGLQRSKSDEVFVAKLKQSSHLHKRYFYLNFKMTQELYNYIEKMSTSINLKYINRNYRRSDLFRGYVIKEIQKRNMPLELFFVPMAETNFNPFAVSKSNAVGMWQFTSNSIKPWLKLDDAVDERKDFDLATNAALEKLKYNYKELGDWLLALSAYNAGLYKIKKIIKENNNIKDFWYYYRNSLFPKQTKDYVLKILSYSYIAGYIGRYGFALDWSKNKKWDVLVLDKTIDIQKLEAEANIKNNVLILANAKYMNGITPHETKSDLKFLSKDRDAIVDVLKNDYKKVQGFFVYKIKKNDTFYSLAKENNISIKLLKLYNQNVDARKIRIGSTLKIPLNEKKVLYKSNSQLINPIVETDFKKFTKFENDNLKTEEKKMNLYNILDVKNNSLDYVVDKNDKFFLIAKKYNISEEFLMFWNHKKNKIIVEGEIIKIPKNNDDTRD